MMRTLSIGTLAVFAVVVACSTANTMRQDEILPAANNLASVSDFATIADTDRRSKAIFAEMSKVLQHPRCTNCHPSDESPYQGNDSLPHRPLVVRGDDGHGAVGMPCSTCHGEANFRNVPGAPKWHLAPESMAWVGKTSFEICEQIKDKKRNGNRDLAQIIDHMANDALVGYAWNPPAQLAPAPGNQQLFGQLVRAWVDSGAACPTAE